MTLDFSEDGGIQYSLICINQSTTSWYFYIYQKASNQSGNGIYSLAWMASPYKLGRQSFITFKWSVDYSFFWFDTGILQTGVVPYAGGDISASLPTANGTTFNMNDNTPQLSAPVQGALPTGFSIIQGSNIPNGIFSTGIGMSGFAILVQQSYMNTMQTLGTKTTFWVAAASQRIQAMEVLSQASITNSTSFAFAANIYSLTATLGEDNSWTIK